MDDRLVTAGPELRALLAGSSPLLPRAVAAARARFSSSAPTFPLTSHEVRELQSNGNTADDWSNVCKTEDAPLATAQIRDCCFRGRVVLGRFSAMDHDVDGVPFSSGLYRTALCNAVVLDDALVRNTLAIRDALVGPRATIVQCGSVLGPASTVKTTSFANGQTLHVGVETGGRDLRAIADLPFALAARVATERGNAELLSQYDAFVNSYTHSVTAEMTIVSADARLLRCSRVESVFVGEFAVVDDCDVNDSTILSTHEEQTALRGKSIARHTLIQPGASIEDLSIVERALLCDCSHVERHGTVLSSVLGANTSVAEGEVTSSFVGPFVGFHHQALLIAAVWPEGKGNVGYGANVGSNHTLKAPDQELLPGEGVFFGLGCNIKYPSNFAAAPYSVIATAVSTLPQMVAMPFALINSPAHVIPTLSPALNEISPGWVLGSSVFTVLRNEHKFRTRNRSTRTTIDPAIFRPDIIQHMKGARTALIKAAGTAKTQLASGEPVFTDKQVAGLGKNYMRESSRTAGITAYTFFIQLFALGALLTHVESGAVKVDTTVGTVNRSDYALATLAEEFPAAMSIAECLRELVAKKMGVAQKAAKGKARDDARGQRIVPDYALVHTAAHEEVIVKEAQRAAEAIKKRVAAFLPRV